MIRGGVERRGCTRESVDGRCFVVRSEYFMSQSNGSGMSLVGASISTGGQRVDLFTPCMAAATTAMQGAEQTARHSASLQPVHVQTGGINNEPARHELPRRMAPITWHMAYLTRPIPHSARAHGLHLNHLTAPLDPPTRPPTTHLCCQ